MPGIVHPYDQFLLLLLRICNDDLEHETVHLGLRKRIGTLLLYRVLGRHHKERLRQPECLVAYRDLPLLHRLEQGRLHLCRGTVDLIRQHEIGEDRPLADLELLALLRIDHRPYHIRRQEVRSELYPAELGVHCRRKRIDGQGFRQSRNTFEQDMSVGEKPYQQILHKMLLPHDDLVHLHSEDVHERTFALNAVIQFFNVYALHKKSSIFDNFALKTTEAGPFPRQLPAKQQPCDT